MRNLAGVKTCDMEMREELRLAEIPEVPATDDERKHTEVPFSIAGQLGAFRFVRAWYYWVVSGPMPIAAARKLNAQWGSYVRVAGMAGGDDPDRWQRDGFVHSYHVDSQAGLCALAYCIRGLP